jgi:hypothetical protein
MPTAPFYIDRNSDPPRGIHPDIALGLLMTGWRVFSNVKMLSSSGLFVVGRTEPVPTVSEVDLWVPPVSHTLTDADLIQGLMMVEEKGGDQVTLDGITKIMLGIPWPAARQMMSDLLKAQEGQSGNAGSNLAEQAGGPNVISFDPAKRKGSKRGVD